METIKDIELLNKKVYDKIDNIDDKDYNNYIIYNEVVDINQTVLDNVSNIKTKKEWLTFQKSIEEIYNVVKSIKEENDLKKFNESGKVYDIEELRKKYKDMNLKKKFPKFDIDKFLNLLENPILKIKNYDRRVINYDPYWVKKNMIAIIQMVFNEMDLYILNIGKEGSGKSCWSSQQILYFYTFFKEVGLIEYSYDITKMFFADINTFLEEHDTQKNNDYFKIECLDEANQLNRSNFRDEANQEFKYQMRTERKMLRVIMLNMQQIGELDTSISLSRVNFIYNCKMRSNKKLGMLTKGLIDMIIIPRSDEIYNLKRKTILKRIDILNTFAQRLDKKKDYYISLPKDMIVHNFKFKNTWGFNKDEYDDYIKDKMRERRFQKTLKLTDQQGYIFLSKLSNWKQLKSFELDEVNDKKMYNVLVKFFGKLTTYFESNPEKYNNMRNYYNK